MSIELFPDEVVLYMCDTSHHNYMGLYRLTKHLHDVLRNYKPKMILTYINTDTSDDKTNNLRIRKEFKHISGDLNGCYRREIYEYKSDMLYWNRKRYDMQTAIGYYRDNAKHGEWVKCSHRHTLSRKIYSFGRLVKRHIYVNGKLKQIIHYDDIGATHGEYPELQMIIYYRSGLIEDVAKSE